MTEPSYAMTVTIDASVEEAETAIREALGAQGFGILTEIDVAGTLASKLGVHRRPYKILGACMPTLADRALAVDERIGLLLPCNVVVAEDEDGGSVVSALDPGVMLDLVDNEAVGEIADEARGRLAAALAAIS